MSLTSILPLASRMCSSAICRHIYGSMVQQGQAQKLLTGTHSLDVPIPIIAPLPLKVPKYGRPWTPVGGATRLGKQQSILGWSTTKHGVHQPEPLSKGPVRRYTNGSTLPRSLSRLCSPQVLPLAAGLEPSLSPRPQLQSSSLPATELSEPLLDSDQAKFPPSTPPPLLPPPPTAAYIHLPFCRRRCHYCDFPIVPVGKLTGHPHVTNRMEDYVDILCREIAVAARAAHAPPPVLHSAVAVSGRTAVSAAPPPFGSSPRPPLETVFFGGGTPSLVPPALLHRILQALDRGFGLSPTAEISMEMDPGSFDEARLREFASTGVNRVSLGVQAFQPELLTACGRAHGLAEVYDAISAMHAVGVENWSLDLISSLPGQTPAMWRHSLSEAMAAQPTHVSVYDLQIEEGTAFGRWYKPGQGPLPSDDLAAEMYREASETFQAGGYEHYEISNYAKPGFRCSHNLVYWHNRPYFGFGLGSASYIGWQRFSRPKKMGEYAKWVDEYEVMEGKIEWPIDSREERLCDWLMLGLRLADGIGVAELKEAFGEEACRTVCRGLLEYVKSGHVLFLDQDKRVVAKEGLLLETLVTTLEIGQIRLSDPHGFLMSNEIISSLFSSFTE